jgi:quercetin dioxygenase-like cupin family protein
MATAKMVKTERKSFGAGDEIRNFPNGQAKIVKVSGSEIGLFTFQPGWRWSKDVKPIAKTKSCESPHFQYQLSGKIGIKMEDGTEIISNAGDVTALPMGHDAWVIGNEPATLIDWYGASDYAKPH